MKSVVKLWVACLREAGALHSVHVVRDEAYASSRIEEEGLSFLTMTLPTFEKGLLQSLSRGFVGSDLFPGFRFRGGLPAFLQGFLRHIFDGTGVLREDACPEVLRSLRQVLLLCSKLELPTTVGRDRRALKAYASTDEQVPDLSPLLREFGRVSRSLLSSYFLDVERLIYDRRWVPRHSGGALATGESFNSRWSNTTWTERLESVLPHWDDMLFNQHHGLDCDASISILPRNSEPPVRVITVPKTMKAPRIIAEEPCWMQFVQQGVLHAMTEVLLQPKHESLLRVFGWLDQDPNRVLAKEGSIDGSYATIDLSEASDRVSLQLVETMLRDTPFLRDAVLACRSETARLPDGSVIRLNKFASMGSSLCFPFESMVFFIVSALAVGDSLNIAPVDLRMRDLPRMRVFGDDIVIPKGVAQDLVDRLQLYGLKVNSTKSFTSGPFRESCGADWFLGRDVSVVKLRSPFPSSRRRVAAFERALSFHNRLYEAGWFRTAEVCRNLLEDVYGTLLYGPFGATAPCIWTHDWSLIKLRHSPRYHRQEFRGYVFKTTKPLDPLDGYGALMKCLAVPPLERASDHLKRDGRSQCVGVHTGWIAT